MKPLAIAAVVVSLCLAASPTGAAEGRDDLAAELSALTDTITSQLKLLGIYEDMGRTEEAEATRKSILERLDMLERVLAELSGELGGEKSGEPPEPERPRFEAPKDLPKLYPGQPRTAAEASERGLAWLAMFQDPDGSWDCDGFMERSRLPDRPDGAGYALYDPGVTGLALLAFLDAGHTSEKGKYRENVRAGLRYLAQVQDPEGCFGPRTSSHFTYSHAIATAAMAVNYGLTRSKEYRTRAQRGIDFVQKCQNPYLAWRYGVRPGDNDTSVTGWMVLALDAGRNAGLEVGPAGFEGAKAWLDKVTEPEDGRVGYTARGTGPARPQDRMDKFPADKSESLTAEGIWIRMAVGEDPDRSEMIQKGVDLILKAPPDWDEQGGVIDMYYWFWATRSLGEIGGRAWRDWSPPMGKALLGNQRIDGASAGSWDPAGPWGAEGGRVYSTALMTLIASQLSREGAPAPGRGGIPAAPKHRRLKDEEVSAAVREYYTGKKGPLEYEELLSFLTLKSDLISDSYVAMAATALRVRLRGKKAEDGRFERARREIGRELLPSLNGPDRKLRRIVATVFKDFWPERFGKIGFDPDDSDFSRRVGALREWKAFLDE